MTTAPNFSMRCADSAERARPTTWWPAPSSSVTTPDPIQPDAPVTKTFIAATSRGVTSVAVITLWLMSVTVNT